MSKDKRAYLAGPMTGHVMFNFPVFDTYRDLYEGFGYEVFSPADHDRELLGKDKNWYPMAEDSFGPWKEWKSSVTQRELPTLRDMLGADLQWIASKATHIAMIPGWENSKGANAEWSLAKALGLVIHYYPMPTEMIDEIRKERGRLV